MTQHLPTRGQIIRCVGVVLGAAAFLSITTMLARADDPGALQWVSASVAYP
jgi:hypothetical protein